jgi:type VI secretion system secreted protein VgrG
VGLSGHAGVNRAGASELNPEAAPLKALKQSQSETLSGDDYAKAAPSRADTAVPHSADALLAVAGRAGIGAIAGQSLHAAAGETLNLGSGEHSNFAVAGQLRLHAGQGIGLLGGAQEAKGEGLNLTAGEGALQVQAQHDALDLKAKDDLSLVSVTAAAEFSAAQSIHLATAGGAFITIEGGSITIGGPGSLAILASSHSFVNPAQLSREMNGWDEPQFDEELTLQWPYDHSPVVNRGFEITRTDGAKIQGTTDAEGRTGLQKSLLLECVDMKLLPEV